jgi:hypothetical protein
MLASSPRHIFSLCPFRKLQFASQHFSVKQEITMATTQRFIAFLLVSVLALCWRTYGWDNLGHMTVAYVAYQHLNAPAKARIDQPLQLNPDYPQRKARVPSGTSAAKMKVYSAQDWDEVEFQPIAAEHYSA